MLILRPVNNCKGTDLTSLDSIRTPGKSKKNWLMPLIFGSIATSLTVYHSLLHPAPLSFFAVLLVSALVTLFAIFILFVTTKNIKILSNLPKLSIFLCSYILIITWLGLNKTIPEYEEIKNFQQKISDLIYAIKKHGIAGMKNLGYLYMYAPPSVKRIEPRANHLGTQLMRVFLTKKIEAGEGEKYAEDMYNIAEVAFIYSSRDIAGIWYNHAYKFGQANALKRYEERMVHYR